MLYTPGLAGFRQQSAFLTEHLASYGFVVVSPDPRGETFEEFWAGAATRPLDIKLIIAYADKLTAPAGELAGLISMEKIGVTGHSSGGWGALMAPELVHRWIWDGVQPIPTSSLKQSRATAPSSFRISRISPPPLD